MLGRGTKGSCEIPSRGPGRRDDAVCTVLRAAPQKAVTWQEWNRVPASLCSSVLENKGRKKIPPPRHYILVFLLKKINSYELLIRYQFG